MLTFGKFESEGLSLFYGLCYHTGMINAIYNDRGVRTGGSARLPERLNPALLKNQFPFYAEGVLYLKGEDGLLSALAVTEQEAKAFLNENRQQDNSLEGLARQLLLGHISIEEADRQCKKHHFTLEQERLALVFSCTGQPEQPPEELLRAVLDDRALPVMLEGRLALIYDWPGTLNEINELAATLRASFISELRTDVHIGVGQPAKTAVLLARSYLQADTALDVGRSITPAGGVWLYKRMLPELLLSGLPYGVVEKYAGIIDEIDAAIDPDTEALVDELFARNLNISKTAQQLYMHRNTLIYKLDKLKKHTGLDVAEFDDAVTLRLVLALARLCKK